MESRLARVYVCETGREGGPLGLHFLYISCFTYLVIDGAHTAGEQIMESLEEQHLPNIICYDPAYSTLKSLAPCLPSTHVVLPVKQKVIIHQS